MSILGLALAAVIGLSLGLLGGGGSILTVPVFVYLLGFGVKEAIATSLAVVAATSLLGAVGHWRSGNVNLRVAAIFGAVAMGGTYLGARLAGWLVHFVPQHALQRAFAVLLVLMGGYILYQNHNVLIPGKTGPSPVATAVAGH